MKRIGSVLVLLAATGCHRTADAPLSVHGFQGAELATPVAKPGFTFTDSKGHPFRFDSATRDKVTLLYFGYSHCPDVCPVHLANLAAVLDKMPDDVQEHVAVVFVTTDPAHDSLRVLDAWVKGFDPGFIGLTAPDSLIRASIRSLGLPATQRTDSVHGDSVTGHASAVVAFTRDGVGRVMYASGTRQQEWAHDLPLLVAFGAVHVP
jgi:protein SCO1/2